MRTDKVGIEKIKDEIKIIRKEAGNKTSGYIVTALGLVAGLAWNDAVKSLIERFFPAQNQNIMAKFIYASILTVVVVLISIYIARLFRQNVEVKIKKEEK